MRFSAVFTAVTIAARFVLAVLLPDPQGIEINPLEGTLDGFAQGITNISSLLNALPAVIQDITILRQSATTVTRPYCIVLRAGTQKANSE
jgi:hypothetical protein